MAYPRILKKNHSGSDVEALQEALIKAGYGSLLGTAQVDGEFGRNTHKAVKRFQEDHGLHADGKVGDNTREALAAFMAVEKPKVTVPPPAIAVKPSASFDSLNVPKFDWVQTMATAPEFKTPSAALPEQIIAAAKAEVGKGESRRDNRGADVTEYKTVTKQKTAGGAWCADFASYILNEEAPGVVKPTSLAKGLMYQFKKEDAFHKRSSSYTPQPGDLIFFNWGKESWQGHVGFVSHVEANGTVHTIEGNRSNPERHGRGWSKHDPDKVREVAYTPAELKRVKVLGYGAMSEMIEAKLGDLPSPATPALAANHTVAQK